MIPTTPLIDAGLVRRKLLGISHVLSELPKEDVAGIITDEIANAENEFALQTKVTLRRIVIKTSPQPGDVYDRIEDPFDYYTSTYAQSAYFQLIHKPVISVERVAIEYNRGEQLFQYPATWFRIRHKYGRLQIVPDANLAAGYNLASAQPISYLPMLRGGFVQGIVPEVVSIDYTAGIPDIQTNPEWAGVRNCLATMAATKVRAAILEMIPTGGSRDGVSSSNVSPAQQIEIAQAEVDAFIQRFRDNYEGPIMAVV